MRTIVALSLVLAGCFIDGTGEGTEEPAGSGASGPTTSSGSTGGGGQGQGGGQTTTTTTTTTTGAGGSECGDGVVSGQELCDPGPVNGDDTDGCDDNCQPTMAYECPAPEFAALMSAGGQLTVTGDTNGAGDDFDFSPNEPCKSDGEDGWIAVRFAAAGTVQATLTVTSGFGSGDRAELHLRRGCASAGMLEAELVCNKTPQGGVTSVTFFAREDEVFYFLIDGDAGGDKGTFSLDIDQTSQCGDGTMQGLEECDMGADTALCVGCLSAPNCATAASAVYDPGRKRCFRNFTQSQTFYAARKACVEQGGDLAVMTLTVPSNDAWVGAGDLNENGTDDFLWLDGQAFTGPWDGSNPDGATNQLRCVMRKGGLATHDDKPCTETHEYVCEKWLANP